MHRCYMFTFLMCKLKANLPKIDDLVPRTSMSPQGGHAGKSPSTVSVGAGDQ